MDWIKRNWKALFLLVLYLVGTIGFLSPSYRDLFAPITPLHLLITAAFLLQCHRAKHVRFWASVLCIGFMGYALEWLGVTTGLLFGHYEYGETLGFKVADVPLMIGINWIIMVYLSADLSQRLFRNIILSSIAAGAMMTGLDMLIEPFAMQFDLWDWDGGAIPVQNYIMWFIAGSIFNYLFQSINKDIRNRLTIPLAAMMTVFFLIVDVFAIWQ